MGLVGFNVTNLVKPALVSLYYKQEINAFYLQLTDLSAANTCFFLVLMELMFMAIMKRYFSKYGSTQQ